jgi:pimeloyl-ACP methyl ester carboxylesterase
MAMTMQGHSQSAGYKFNQYHLEAVIQGLGEESNSFPYNSRIILNTIEVAPGKKLQYAEKGTETGAPVLFLHGLSDSWHSFEKILPLLPADIHAFALTQRGHGGSDKTFTGYSVKDFALDVAAFIAKQNLKKVVLVGHSLGGVVAQQFALDNPDLIQAVVLINTTPSFKSNPEMLAFQQQALQMGDSINLDFMEAFQKSTLAKPIDPAYFNTIVSEGMKTPAAVFKAATNGIMEVNFTDRLKEVKKPVLIFWGDKDGICLRAQQDLMLQQLPDAKLIVYENTGHALHWEEPTRFAGDLLRFIRANTVQH